MTNVVKKRNSRRRLAALTFLSNISLDGTHRDTNLRIFNSHEYVKQVIKRNQSEEMYRDIYNDGEMQTFHKEESDKNCKLNICSVNSHEKISFLNCGIDNGHISNEKDKIHTVLSEARSKILRLSQRRKQLQHQHSLQETQSVSSDSTENLGVISRRCSEDIILPEGKTVSTQRHGSFSKNHSLHVRKSSASFSESTYPAVLELTILKNPQDHHIQNKRVVLVSSKKAPFVIFSSLPYTRRHSHCQSRGEFKQDPLRRRHLSSSRQLSVINDGPDPLDLLALLELEKPKEGQDVSYSQFLAPSVQYRHCKQESEYCSTIHNNLAEGGGVVLRSHTLLPTSPLPANDKVMVFEWEETQSPCHHPCHTSGPDYNPYLLDDPELIAGKHSTLLAFCSYITSVIDYVKPSDLKKNLNDKFREQFPHIQLTLSKLRSLKKEMRKIAKNECGMDLLTVAQAYVYFEKLILKMLINKQNRKLCAGACLLLSAKLNDIKGIELRNLIEKTEIVFRLGRRDLLNAEFGVLVALEFSLHLPVCEILPHYQWLIYES